MAKNKKPLNLDNLPSLNLNTPNTSNWESLAKEDLKSGKIRGKTVFTAFQQADQPFFKALGQAYKKNPGLFDNFFMKKGGQVKAKKPKDGRMKKAKCRDGIAQRGKTQGKIR